MDFIKVKCDFKFIVLSNCIIFMKYYVVSILLHTNCVQ